MRSASGTRALERGEALAGRAVGQALALQPQAVEEEGAQRQLGARALDVQLAAEAAHRDLERLRPAGGGEGEHLAVEDQLAGGQGARELDRPRAPRR